MDLWKTLGKVALVRPCIQLELDRKVNVRELLVM